MRAGAKRRPWHLTRARAVFHPLTAEVMPADPQRFRQVMGRFATGVTVVTSRTEGNEPCGLTANAVASVSLEPLLVLVCVSRSSATHDALLARGAFAVNVLDEGAETVARRFSDLTRAGRFEGVDIREEVTGSPILGNALAWVDCTLEDTHAAGDHSIVVGRVRACGDREGRPLLFFGGAYRELAGP